MKRRSLQSIQKQLQSSSYKLTPQRQMTLQVLLEKDDSHMSAEEIYIQLKKKYPSIGLATVYRTLDILTELGVVYKVTFEDGISRYDLKMEGNEHFHHHLLCLECGRVEEIADDLLTDIEPLVEQEFQFKILDHRLTFHGICHDCQLKKKGEE
ncbi:transcriptional repressor [Atopobacter sp. AH10]|uniref:ferric iron uptake transcriptional regulator n=1 Tax=Atopobacter sp. AH10 TaxID=2315861 RepID=UPI000EF1D40B|nr:Fur family transcriptional regulator [Atopobacter sp. AH10]RLK63222.1 transcriptional repressor [Atopobacter sp. AH10]